MQALFDSVPGGTVRYPVPVRALVLLSDVACNSITAIKNGIRCHWSGRLSGLSTHVQLSAPIRWFV